MTALDPLLLGVKFVSFSPLICCRDHIWEIGMEAFLFGLETLHVEKFRECWFTNIREKAL